MPTAMSTAAPRGVRRAILCKLGVGTFCRRGRAVTGARCDTRFASHCAIHS